MNDYIFVVGAPGSRWSGVVKSIYYSESINRSDYSQERLYHNLMSNKVMHLGSYFDPGMEFGDGLDNFNSLSKTDLIEMFDSAFTEDTGTKIIKSHKLAEHIGHLALLFDCPIVMVYRTNEDCFKWWKEAGGWDITYPNYRWYKDDLVMKHQIAVQNKAIQDFKERNNLYTVSNNIELSEKLKIKKPKTFLNFDDCDVYVKLPLDSTK
jgi:hypothetical protein